VELTRRQRNDIFEALQAKGVDPADCEVNASLRTDAWTGAAMSHTPTNSVFAIAIDLPAFCSFTWRVFDGPNSGPSETCKNWDDILEQLGYWADEVRYVAETPNLWAELQQVPEVMATAQSADASNAAFTPDEQAEITRRLDEVKQLVREKFELVRCALLSVGTDWRSRWPVCLAQNCSRIYDRTCW
jgi:hypothetical protein